MARPASPLSTLQLLVLDVDGVLTDGRLYFGPRMEALKVFHVRDGPGVKALSRAGVTVAVISGRRSAAVARRCRELGIREVHQGVADKAKAYAALIARLEIGTAASAVIGDDTPDLPIMLKAGFAVAVADAHPTVRRAAHRSTQAAGGFGAVREVCDWLLAARGADRR
jgi:3-deoxy-D-manno-octulosonate 8-phosphate phosphatase (KDO 8-P phosphatase)